MKTVIVGSQNPVKIEVARQAFEAVFPEEQFEFVGYKAQSNVSDQPKSDEETLLGAYNRHNGMELGPAADKLFGVSNSKQQGSIIGLLTNNLVDRTSTYLQSAIFALFKHKHPELYQ